MRTPLELENLFRSAHDVYLWHGEVEGPNPPTPAQLTSEEIDFVARAVAFWASEQP